MECGGLECGCGAMVISWWRGGSCVRVRLGRAVCDGKGVVDHRKGYCGLRRYGCSLERMIYDGNGMVGDGKYWVGRGRGGL